MSFIAADSTILMRQAPMTAAEYLDAAVKAIDARFGKGYAKAHPELVGAFIEASAVDLGAAVIAKAIGELAQATEALTSIARFRAVKPT
jgi:hypothetical protein